MGSVTTIHWGEATVEGSRAMRDAGYVGQLGISMWMMTSQPFRIT
jgi:hypothetical protein